MHFRRNFPNSFGKGVGGGQSPPSAVHPQVRSLCTAGLAELVGATALDAVAFGVTVRVPCPAPFEQNQPGAHPSVGPGGLMRARRIILLV